MTRTSAPRLRRARTPSEIAATRELFTEYSKGLGVDLCFQNFSAELAALPGEYAPPHGDLLLARVKGRIAGCIALRRLSNEDAEMKRLYVRDDFRGTGCGLALTFEVIRRAHRLGYRRLLLDTLPNMKKAQALYESLGFVDIGPYRPNPVPGARFMALNLKDFRKARS